MRLLYYLSFTLFFLLVGCKKETVDGSSVKNFQESINEMATTLSTLQQTKFNEALYILKTFGVEGDTDMQKLEALAKLIDGKKIKDIFEIADEVAKKNNVDWASSAPPSLGEMNIFQNISAKETDPNDIMASALDITIKPIEVDSLLGPKAIMVIPRLVDTAGNPILFSNAGLETIMEVYSNGERLLTSKNLMVNNEFKGFYLKMNALPIDKVVDSAIDIKVSVKTTKKTYQLLKAGVKVNGNILKQSVKINDDSEMILVEGGEEIEKQKPLVKPEIVVNKFLGYLSSQNFRAAYDISDNPNWGAYDKFANPGTGFGGVKNINVKGISTLSNSDRNAIVNASYQVIDKDGNITDLNVSYELKQVESSWKIVNYKINSSEKQ